VPYVVFTHGMLDPWFKRTYPLKHFKKCVYWPVQYWILRQAETVMFTSTLERDLAPQSFWPQPLKQPCCSVWNGRTAGSHARPIGGFVWQIASTPQPSLHTLPVAQP
jgi:hypothetical protein